MFPFFDLVIPIVIFSYSEYKLYFGLIFMYSNSDWDYIVSIALFLEILA